VSEISIDDLKANTHYTAGYSMVDRNISRFWSVVSAFNDVDRALLIKFVTSCERPPSLGFGDLNPPFTIQVGALKDCEVSRLQPLTHDL
jgi:ubiquitin-protein ligase E3 C